MAMNTIEGKSNRKNTQIIAKSRVRENIFASKAKGRQAPFLQS